jgi:hypothetical protein
LGTLVDEIGIIAHDQRTGPELRKTREGCVDLSLGACAQDVKLNPERARGVLRRSRFGVDDGCGLLKSHTGEVIAVARGIAVGH